MGYNLVVEFNQNRDQLPDGYDDLVGLDVVFP